MDFFVVRNKKQATDLAEMLLKRRLPYKVAIQDVFPLRSLQSNAYYWGIVLAFISDASGHTQLECHEAYKVKYNFRYDIEYNPETKQFDWNMGVKSTTILDEKEIWEYIFKVRVDGELEHHIIIPLPNECFIPEINFRHDKIELRRM